MDRRKTLNISKRPEENLNVMRMEIGRHRIRVVVRKGLKDQPPLLIMNGLGVNLEVFNPFLEVFGDTVETIRFDPPGIGGSSISYLPYRFGGLSMLAANILDRLGHEKADVLGISWGGGLAQQFAHQFPDRCRHLILAATGTGAIMIPGRLKAIMKMLTPMRFSLPNYLKKVAPVLYGGKIRENPEMVESLIQNISRRWIMGYYFQLLAGMGWTSIHWLHKLSQPTLILAGMDDPIIRPLNAKIMAKLIPNSTLHWFDCGHLFLFTCAEEASQIISNFNLSG